MKNKCIVAVSGGVDSVVLLDMAVRGGEYDEIIVAHFNHGIRDDSNYDEKFVELLAQKYGLKYVHKRESLGESASEELARNRRYKFLRNVAKSNDAIIMTAHHADDVIETIALNIDRSTGWRGLAVLDSPDILRPLINLTKKQVYGYAVANNLEWLEDKTNKDMRYHRNRLRAKLYKYPDKSKLDLRQLREKQVQIKRQIDSEVVYIIQKNDVFSRYFMIMIDELSAIEILRHITKGQLTRPQMGRLLHAIRRLKSGASYHAGKKQLVKFTKSHYKLQ